MRPGLVRCQFCRCTFSTRPSRDGAVETGWNNLYEHMEDKHPAQWAAIKEAGKSRGHDEPSADRPWED